MTKTKYLSKIMLQICTNQQKGNYCFMDKFQNKYRIPSARLQSWNYAWVGSYFITICTQGRLCYFGDIVPEAGKANQIQYTELGFCAQQCALEIPNHFPFVQMDEFMVMPNHIHLLFTMHKTNAGVETQDFASLPPPTTQPQTQNQFGPQSKNVASIIRGFKIGISKFARIHGLEFGWQSRFHDHIVRSPEEFERIKYYIQNNVTNWGSDTLRELKE